MPHGDKYIGLTNYLKSQHKMGNDRFTMTFTEIERACGFPLTHTMRTYFWANDKTQSYALGWMLADFVVVHCDLQGEKITYQYDPQKVESLFAGQGKSMSGHHSSKRAKELHSKNEVNLGNRLPISIGNIEKVNRLFQEDVSYQTDNDLIKAAFARFPKNTEPEIVAMKVSLIDLTNSTHIGLYREKLYLKELVDIIMGIPDFDERVAAGDPELVNTIARANGQINLFSFASKYCLYHNTTVYHRDDYSLYDRVVATALPGYVEGLTKARIDRWRTTYDYISFKNCIEMLLNENNILIPNRRRKFDIFLWYLNRKNDGLSMEADE